MAAVRLPGEKGKRRTETRELRTWTSSLGELRCWLVGHGVTQVAMEATGVYWTAPWHVLYPEPSFELLLVNAQHVKNLPGRKTDVTDAQWLASLIECGLLRGSFVPDPVTSRLRDLTRYRKKLTEERARETQRIQKVLDDAGIKLDSVVSDVLGKSPRHMIEALIADRGFHRRLATRGPPSPLRRRSRRRTVGPGTARASYESFDGAPPHDPTMMPKLLLWGYSCGVTSSREMERRCSTDVAFRYFCAKQAPDYRSIARFRRRHLPALPGITREPAVGLEPTT
jgi:hypothetical protein